MFKNAQNEDEAFCICMQTTTLAAQAQLTVLTVCRVHERRPVMRWGQACDACGLVAQCDLRRC